LVNPPITWSTCQIPAFAAARVVTVTRPAAIVEPHLPVPLGRRMRPRSIPCRARLHGYRCRTHRRTRSRSSRRRHCCGLAHSRRAGLHRVQGAVGSRPDLVPVRYGHGGIEAAHLHRRRDRPEQVRGGRRARGERLCRSRECRADGRHEHRGDRESPGQPSSDTSHDDEFLCSMSDERREPAERERHGRRGLPGSVHRAFKPVISILCASSRPLFPRPV